MQKETPTGVSIEFHQGIPNIGQLQQQQQPNTPPTPLFLILDDLTKEAASSGFLDTFFTKGSHHLNISIAVLTQDLFYKDTKTSRYNAHYIVLMKNPSGARQSSNKLNEILNSPNLDDSAKFHLYSNEMKRLQRVRADRSEQQPSIKSVAPIADAQELSSAQQKNTPKRVRKKSSPSGIEEEEESDEPHDDDDFETPQKQSPRAERRQKFEALRDYLDKNRQRFGIREDGYVYKDPSHRDIYTRGKFENIAKALTVYIYYAAVSRSSSSPIKMPKRHQDDESSALLPRNLALTLQRLYYDPQSSASFSSADRLFQYLNSQRTYTLYRRSIERFRRLKTQPSGLNTDWQADLMDVRNISRENQGYNYLLVCIDVLSRMIYFHALKQKTSEQTMRAFDAIFHQANVRPWRIFTDRGTEFTSRVMKQYFQEKGIIKIEAYTHDVLHATLAERCIRTIRERMTKYFSENFTRKWTDVMEKLVDGLNSCIHTTTGMRPKDVTYENAEALRARLYDSAHHEQRKPRFKVGDWVRIAARKRLFNKTPHTFTDELFVVSRALEKRMPIVYKLEDFENEPLLGYFYEPDLVKVNKNITQRIEKVLRRKLVHGEPHVYVKWFGQPKKTQFQWIPKSALL
uniref:Integrase catalytic domain-containing protein n=1 Tax=Acrobeloides nanus TaxID=290746 RepID=A0A914DY97_9BILA